MWMENASDIWNTLKKRYYQGDVFRISDLQEELYLLKQGDATITSYFTKLKGLIQELDNFRHIPSCTCAVVCACDLIPIIKLVKMTKLYSSIDCPNSNKPCETCHFAKQKRLPFPDSITVSSQCFDLLHMDIWGPYAHPSLLGHKYFLTIVDDKSRYT